jgi:dihydroflavonol-4-reductase
VYFYIDFKKNIKVKQMVFVTGGTGLVGTRLIIDLLDRGEEVIALIRPGTTSHKFEEMGCFYTPHIQQMGNSVQWVECDLLDLERLYAIIPPKAKVYHCAAMVSFNPADSKKLFESNVEGTANLVNVCLAKEVEKFCHVSSIGALGGKLIGQSIDEKTPWSGDGKSAYSLSKYYAEMEVWRGMAEGLSAVIVNPAVILGPGIWDHGSPRFFKRAHNGQSFYTLGSTSYVDVRDVSRAMILLMESPIEGERFVLASETLTYKDLFSQMAEALNAKAPSQHANKLVTSLTWRLLRLGAFFTGKAPVFTRHTHRNSHLKDDYSGLKIRKTLTFEYTPISETIKFVAEKFNHQNSSK